jgi:Tol biopolymer transport system component
MAELMEVFEMVTKQTEPDLDAWKQQEDRQRKAVRKRRYGAFAAVAVIAAAAVFVFVATRPSEDTSAPQPGENGSDTSGQAPAFGLDRVDRIVVGLDGQTVQTIPGLPEDAFALSPSADGATIAFVTARDGENHVATIGLDGSGMQVLGAGIEPAMSPDGTKIAFVRDNDIYVMNADGSNEQKIVGNPHVDEFPQWSPDGTMIAFDHYASKAPTDSGFSEKSSIMVVPVTGGGPTTLTQGGTAGEPTYSPDGSQIAFRRDNSIWVIGAAGSNEQELAPEVGVVDDLRWSPDGTTIAFSNYNGGDWEAHVVQGVNSGNWAVGNVQYLDVRTGEISDVGLTIVTWWNAPNWLASGDLLLNAVSQG